jgi:hypothetical protein
MDSSTGGSQPDTAHQVLDHHCVRQAQEIRGFANYPKSYGKLFIHKEITTTLNGEKDGVTTFSDDVMYGKSGSVNARVDWRGSGAGPTPTAPPNGIQASPGPLLTISTPRTLTQLFAFEHLFQQNRTLLELFLTLRSRCYATGSGVNN